MAVWIGSYIQSAPNRYYASVEFDASAHIEYKSGVAIHINSNQCAELLQASYLQPTSEFPQSRHAEAETILFGWGVPWTLLSLEAISQRSLVIAY